MDDEPIEGMSIFQGFGRGWETLLWAMHALVEMPANVLEVTWPLEGLLAQRMGGANHQTWIPITTSALDSLLIDELGFCVVVFTGAATSAKRAADWAARQRRPVFHVSMEKLPSAITPDKFDLFALRDHCLAIYSRYANEISPDRTEAALAALALWTERKPIQLDLPEIGHNCATPNHMVLRRMGRVLGDAHPHWSSVEEADYTEAVIQSATAVMDARRSITLQDSNRFYILHLKMVLTEPALFRYVYTRSLHKGTPLAPATTMMLRRMKQQKGLSQRIEKDQLRLLNDSREWTIPVAERQRELAAQATAVGLMAAQSGAAVVRLRPEVNHVFPKLSELARNIRADSAHARHKSPQLLRRVQDALVQAIGSERIGFIEQHGGPIKIVADAPIELLPINGLPLAMRYETSRINATPGNLMMGELVGRPPITVLPDDLMRVLVVSAFTLDDPLRDDMRLALERLEQARPGQFSVDFRRVETEDEFVEAVNSSDAAMMIFDGHGVLNDGNRVGGLRIGEFFVDVWRLRQRMQSPPIVILSACDTHGLDAPSHATVGNSFIALGAMTVLATVLPVGGKEAALFVYRMLAHLSDFVPAATSSRQRLLSWTEVMASVLRLTLAKDVLSRLSARGLLSSGSDALIFSSTLRLIVTGDSDWFERLRVEVAEAAPAPVNEIDVAIRAAIAGSEAIRYIQLGVPERITIGDRALFDELRSKVYSAPEP